MFDKVLVMVEKFLISVGFAAATLITFANVVARYFFETGFPWALELVQYLFAWIVLIGSAYGFRESAHLGINILVDKFQPKHQRILAIFAWIATMLFLALLFYLSVVYTMRIYEWGDLTLDLRIPQWIPYMAIPVGLSLMLFHLIYVGIEIFAGRRLKLVVTEADAEMKKKESTV